MEENYTDKSTNQTGTQLTPTQKMAIDSLRKIEADAESTFKEVKDLAEVFNDDTVTGQEVDIATFIVGLRRFKSGISTMVEAVAQPDTAVYRVLKR